MACLFYASLAVTLVLQCIDAGLAVAYIDYINEYNPICEALLQGGAVPFVAAKVIGTSLAMGVAHSLYRARRHYGMAASVSMATAMAGVVAYQLLA